MKKIIFILIVFCLQLVHAKSEVSQEFSFIGRIEGHGAALKVIRSLEGDALPGMLENNRLEEKLQDLQKGDEVLIQGHVSYETYFLEGVTKMKPIFVVKSLTPISLARLGSMKEMKIPDSPTITSTKVYAPVGIPISTEVASAITMTSSLLLLQSFTSSGADPQIKQQLNSGLILFAGLMATTVFIYDQITKPITQGSKND